MSIAPVSYDKQTERSSFVRSCACQPSKDEQSLELADANSNEQPLTPKLSDVFADKSRAMLQDANKSSDIYDPNSKPHDSASQLTHRLVAASTQFSVRSILSDANKNLINLRIIAAIGKGEDAALAKVYVKKLEKLVGRAHKKIEDLDKEDMLKIRKAKAERHKQKQRVEEIKDKLQKERQRRGMKENGYLLEDLHDKIFRAVFKWDVSSEMAITVRAEAIAAAELTGLSGADNTCVSADIAVPADVGAGCDAAASGEGVDISI